MITKQLIQVAVVSMMLSLLPVSAAAQGKGKGASAPKANVTQRQGAEQKFVKLDTSGDGLISFDEFAAGDHRRFVEMDANDDGVITIEEMSAAIDLRASKRKMRNFNSADQDGNGSLTLQEMQRNAFTRMDRDGDSKLSGDELERRCAFQHRHDPLVPPVTECRVADMDTDNNGTVSIEEFNAYAHDYFHNLDKDGDGSVSTEELRNTLQARRTERITERFMEMDTTPDGMVTLTEMLEHAFTRMDHNEDGFLDAEEFIHHGRPGRR